jgi:hypothetical protein
MPVCGRCGGSGYVADPPGADLSCEGVSVERCPLHYDGAPRAITHDEAQAIAEQEIDCCAGDRGWIVRSRGSDGGMHYRASEPTRALAIANVMTRRRELVERIMAGACAHTMFYDRARDRFYMG